VDKIGNIHKAKRVVLEKMTLQRNIGRHCVKKVGPLSSDYVSDGLEY